MSEQQLKTFFLRLTICLLALAILAAAVLLQLGSELSTPVLVVK